MRVRPFGQHVLVAAALVEKTLSRAKSRPKKVGRYALGAVCCSGATRRLVVEMSRQMQALTLIAVSPWCARVLIEIFVPPKIASLQLNLTEIEDFEPTLASKMGIAAPKLRRGLALHRPVKAAYREENFKKVGKTIKEPNDFEANS